MARVEALSVHKYRASTNRSRWATQPDVKLPFAGNLLDGGRQEFTKNRMKIRNQRQSDSRKSNLCVHEFTTTRCGYTGNRDMRGTTMKNF